jgi:CPA2 family monovalent cation:H+ antiporter-2
MGVAAIEIVFMLGLSFAISYYFGWSLIEALFLGTALASSSTAIISKALGDMKKMQETPTLIMLGVLVIEDLVVIGLLAMITANIDNGTINFANIGFAVVKTITFIVGSLVFGIIFIPPILNRILKTGNKEAIILTVLGLVFGLSVLAYRLGFPLAVGAFLMGVIVAGWQIGGNHFRTYLSC